MYLGAYDEEEAAARAYDLAALKYWGATTYTNFPVMDYDKELKIMETLTKEEYLASLRRWHMLTPNPYHMFLVSYVHLVS